jgi:OOP family OmpA-OmpF porin
MKKILFVLSIVWLMLQAPAIAQYDGAPHGLTLRHSWTNYHFPITNENLSASNFNEAGLEIGYVRHLNNFLNLAIPINLGSANLPVSETEFQDRQFVGNLDALLHLKYFKEPNFINPYLLAGIGGNFEFKEQNFNAQIPVGIGLNFRLGRHFYFNAQTTYRFGINDLRDNLQHGMGIMVLLGSNKDKDELTEMENPDSDGDGIVDEDDDCPEVPGSADLNGCPDADGDGVADKYDLCPSIAGTKATRGCPDGDGDGIRDADDRCPNAAGSAGLDGCPDTDGDGLADPDDDCPEKAGLASMDGCPDTDKDGVADNIDKCPTKAGPPSNDGCPELKEDEKAVLDFATQAVEFETGKAVLLPDSKIVLNQIADILKNYPEYYLKIDGHTDSVGEEKRNLTLSKQRAASCQKYLESRGIAAERIQSEGYGETRPIADNRYKDGRQKNRRVEFKIYLP